MSRVRIKRFLRLAVVNISVGIAIALLLTRIKNANAIHPLSIEIPVSLIHSIYGFAFGLSAPYLGERFELLSMRWRWLAGFSSLAFISVVSTFVVQSILFILRYAGTEAFGMEFWYKAATVSIIASIIAISVHGYESIRTQIQLTKLQLRTQELEKERTLKLLSEARLASLESRLQPHFLFNTLNSISALILEDPPVADVMVQRLARLLRASLDACEQESVSLQRELELTSDYLEIEQARFRERLRYQIDVPNELRSLEVPPIVLQPLVENSVKFAIGPRPSGGSIKISARKHARELQLEVWDDGPGFTKEMFRSGHGLDNLQSRLRVLFGSEAQLDVRTKAGGSAVLLSLPA